MRFALGNVVEESLANPGYEIPPARLRESLEPGDLAELMLLSDTLEKATPAWAEVTDVLGPGIYAGIFESGEPVEFGAEHVSDLAPREGPSPTMGAKNPDPFEILRRRPKPEGQREPDPFEILRQPKTRRPSPYQILREDTEPPQAPPPAGAKAPEAPKPQRRSFFDFINIFRRKPKVDVGPIPEAERRAAPSFIPGLPAPVIEAPPPPPRQAEPPAPPAPAPMVIIAPPPPPAPAAGGLVVVPEGVPQDLFTILAPAPDAPPPARPPSGGLIVSEPMMPAPLAPEADVFEILAPAPAERPPAGGLVVRGEDLPAPLSEPLDAFTMIVPAAPPPGTLAPVGPATPFDILAPAQEMTPFDILVPEASEERGMVSSAAPGGAMSVFDILETPGGSELAPYDPKALDPFSMIAPEAPAAGVPPFVPTWGGGSYTPTPVEEEPEVEEPRKKKPRKKRDEPIPPKWTKRGDKWVMPSPQAMEKYLREIWNLERLWDAVREYRTDPNFQEAVEAEDFDGAIPLETIAHGGPGEYDDIEKYFGIPKEVMGPQLEKIYEMADRGEDPSQEEEELWEFLQDFYSNSVNPGVDLVTPKDIPGHVYVTNYEDQIVFAYFEEMSPAERRKLDQARKREAERIEAEKEERKKALKRIWGRMPTPEELEPFLEEKFDLPQMWTFIRKERKSRDFKEARAEEGQAVVFLEEIAEEGDESYNNIAYYFSLPPEIFELYLNRDEPLEKELWQEVLKEFFSRVQLAFLNLKPNDLPGVLLIGQDDDENDNLYLEYVEQEDER